MAAWPSQILIHHCQMWQYIIVKMTWLLTFDRPSNSKRFPTISTISSISIEPDPSLSYLHKNIGHDPWSNRSNKNIAIIHFESPSQFLLRVASLRHVSGQHELLTHFKGITINKDFQCLKVILTIEMKTLKSMEPLLSESNFWNIWSTNVLDFVPVRTELYISIILSLLSWPSGLSWSSTDNHEIHMLCVSSPP